jgi:beta-ureidopropionase
MVMIVPVYEREMSGVLYNTAAVIDADGTYLGKYRKQHIPQVNPGFFEKFFFKPGNRRVPRLQTRYAKVGVYICYDRHFPEGARCLGLNGAEIVFNPSRHRGRTLAVPLEDRAARARRRQRVLHGQHQPRRHRGALEHRQVLRHQLLRQIPAARSSRSLRGQRRAARGRPRPREIEEVRSVWQFYRDRRPEAYKEITET